MLLATEFDIYDCTGHTQIPKGAAVLDLHLIFFPLKLYTLPFEPCAIDLVGAKLCPQS